MSKYAAFFAVKKRMEKSGDESTRQEIISDFTDGSKSSLKELSDQEYNLLIRKLTDSLKKSEKWQQTPENVMRRKIIALFVHQMGYTMSGLNDWCLRYGKFKKALNGHSKKELTELVTQAEFVYQDYLKRI